MIDGKLVELGREPKNVQIIIPETSLRMQAFMMDESGVFLMTKPIENPTQELEGLRHDFEVQLYKLDATLEALKREKYSVLPGRTT